MLLVKNISNDMGQGSIFIDPKVKAEMINLRKSGKTYKELATKYKVDHSSIVYHCQEAGLTLKNEQRFALFTLAKQGLTTRQISKRLNLSGTVIDFYCSRHKVKRGCLKTNPNLVFKPVLVKKDEHGVEWHSDLSGGWICVGKSKEQQKVDQLGHKRKELEERRLQMLIY